MRTIFVGGSQRSGTTMVQLLLCQANDTNPMIKEASYLRFLVEAYHEAKTDFENDTVHYFDSVDDLRTFHAGIVGSFLERTLARFPGARRLVLKEPHLTLYFPDVLELVPDARFVLVVRDPRDTIASMIGVGEKIRALGQEHFFQARNMAQLCSYFKMFYAPCLNAHDRRFTERLLVVRYEDVALRSKKVLRALREFTGIRLPRNRERAESLNSGAVDWDRDYQRRYRPWRTEKFGRTPEASSIGRHRETLTPSEIAQIDAHCRDFNRLFDYRPAP